MIIPIHVENIYCILFWVSTNTFDLVFANESDYVATLTDKMRQDIIKQIYQNILLITDQIKISMYVGSLVKEIVELISTDDSKLVIIKSN
jgi:hypothetical protein